MTSSVKVNVENVTVTFMTYAYTYVCQISRLFDLTIFKLSCQQKSGEN